MKTREYIDILHVLIGLEDIKDNLIKVLESGTLHKNSADPILKSIRLAEDEIGRIKSTFLRNKEEFKNEK